MFPWDVVWWQHGSHSSEKHELSKAGYYWQGQKLHQILMFHREWGLSIFMVEWFPRTWKIKITSTSPVQDLSGFTRKTAALSSPDLFLALQGSDEILFISVHPEEETQLYWVPVSYWPRCFTEDMSLDLLSVVQLFYSPLCQMRKQRPNSMQDTIRYSVPGREVYWLSGISRASLPKSESLLCQLLADWSWEDYQASVSQP